MSYEEILKPLHTKQLLAMRDMAYATGYCFYVNEGKEYKITLEEIVKVLGTREHVPNKDEAKKIRQEKAKDKKHIKSKSGYARIGHSAKY
jgi:hypothetical protein